MSFLKMNNTEPELYREYQGVFGGFKKGTFQTPDVKYR